MQGGGELIHDGIAAGVLVSVGRDRDGWANGQTEVHGAVDGRVLMAKRFFIAFDGFDQSFRGGVVAEVVRRKMECLFGHGDGLELPPAFGALFWVKAFFHQIREHGFAEVFHAHDDGVLGSRGGACSEPLGFEGAEDVLAEGSQAFVGGAGAGFSMEFHFFHGQEGFAQLNNAFPQRQAFA